MMEQRVVKLKDITLIAKDTFKLDLELDHDRLARFKPGQFIHIRLGTGTEFMLRRPISIADIDLENGYLTVIFKVFGEGTRALSKVKPGEMIDILIPCGNGYPIDEIDGKSALLIGGGVGVPPLYYLAKKLVSQNIKVTTIIGFQTKDEIFYKEEFEELGTCFVTTDDGSYGTKGFVTDVIAEEQIDLDYYFSCGPTPMLKAVEAQLKDYPGYLSLEERMGCGIGACYACVVPSADGTEYKKVCIDGPVFKSNEVRI